MLTFPGNIDVSLNDISSFVFVFGTEFFVSYEVNVYACLLACTRKCWRSDALVLTGGTPNTVIETYGNAMPLYAQQTSLRLERNRTQPSRVVPYSSSY
jgi:hypothetical protein